MTIYKTQANTEEKKDLVDFEVLPEVAILDVDQKVTDEKPTAPVKRRKRSRTTVAVASLLCSLFVCCAIAGSVILFLKLRHRGRFNGTCGVRYVPERGFHDEVYGEDAVIDYDYGAPNAQPHHQGEPHRRGPGGRHGEERHPYGHPHGRPMMIDHGGMVPPGDRTTAAPSGVAFHQEVEIDVELGTERIVPKIDSHDTAVFLHDFGRNLTAIRDVTDRVCYVVSMEDAPVPAWTTLRDLIMNMITGAYDVDAGMIQREFTVVRPAVSDPRVFGPFVDRECRPYPVYRLAKVTNREGFNLSLSLSFTEYPGGAMMHRYRVGK